MSPGKAQNMKTHHRVKLARNYKILPFQFWKHMTIKKQVMIIAVNTLSFAKKGFNFG